MFGFSSKVYCTLKEKKVKKSIAKTCPDLTLASPPKGMNGATFGIMVARRDKKIYNCEHCAYCK